MIVQISSGQGPAECELAVEKLYQSLQKEYQDIELVSAHRNKRSNGYSSIQFSTKHDVQHLEGSVLWVCKSPYRPNHGRKNWYVDVSILPEVKKIRKDGEIRIETFHCGGNGGQNVNKVETGVRLSHIPSGITVTSTAERSQYLNRKDAMKKLKMQVEKMEIEAKEKQKNGAWREHTHIVRGNPVRTYEGMNFKLKRKS